MLKTDGLRCWAQIDTDAIAHNVKEIQKLVGDTKVMGIVKANAYGHGALACTKALQKAGVDYFGVACLQEAIELREGNIKDPILILGYTPPTCFEILDQLNLHQSILSYDYAKKMNEWALENHTKLKGHVKLDTGMNRTGFLYQDGAKEKEELLDTWNMPGLQIDGIFSHFPVSDDLEKDSADFTRHQMDLFDEAIEEIKKAGYHPGLRHIQNSYGILNYQDRGYDYCRPGLLYMGVTSDDSVPVLSNPDFIPILSLKAKVSMVKTIPQGATVSYGRHFKAKKPTKIASLTIGYADGLPRICSNQDLKVLIRGHLVPIVGNICMDQCMADISGFDDIKEGDIVTLIGEDQGTTVTLDTITRLAHTINNETLTSITSRVERFDLAALNDQEKDI